MFQKTGNVFTIVDTNRVKQASDWTDFLGSDKVSTADGIVIHKNLDPSNDQPIVCQIDLDNYVYIHTTIMASVDLEPDSDHFITRSTEKYINTNGDAWPRDQLLKDYGTFKTAAIYVEHDQNPERAKGKVLDAVARDMGDTVLIDLLLCVDRRHGDLVHNIETGIANAVSMGCTTKWTICSICGHTARDEKEYCVHVKRQKSQMIRCVDGVYRKACELCFDSNFYDCSIVANPAFAGAIFRRLVAADQVSSQLLSNLLCRKVSSSTDYQDDIMKLASVGKETSHHPIEKVDTVSYNIEDEGLGDIPYRDPHDVKEVFDEQQPKGQKIIDIGTKKKAAVEKCADFGSLVMLKKRFDIPPDDRKVSHVFNFVTENTVGRLVGRSANTCAVYFSKLGMIKNIPSDVVVPFSVDACVKDNGTIVKQAKAITDEELLVRRKGIFLPTNERFQILKIEDDAIEVRWLDGRKSGIKEKLLRKTLNDKIVKWASVNELASFNATWNGEFYQLKTAKWNEKQSNVLDRLEAHIDNVQHDVTTVMPRKTGCKYGKSFSIHTKIGSDVLHFSADVDGEKINIDVKSTTW
jgi:hypothetical protein